MAHTKVDQASTSSCCAARRPREDDMVVGCNTLPRGSVINLCNLPAKTRTRCEQHKWENEALLVVGQESEQSLHI